MPDWSPLKIAETAASDWFWKGRIPPLQFWTNVTMHESSNVFPSFFLFFSLFSFLSYEFPFLSFSSPSVISTFLDASLHLYKRVCPSVGRSVRPSVRRSVGPSVTHELKPCKITVFDQIYWQYERERILCRVSGLVSFREA